MIGCYVVDGLYATICAVIGGMLKYSLLGCKQGEPDDRVDLTACYMQCCRCSEFWL